MCAVEVEPKPLPIEKRPKEVETPYGTLSLVDKEISVLDGKRYLVRTCDCGERDCPELPIVINMDKWAESPIRDIDPIKARVTLIQRAIKVTITLKYTEPGEIVENEINKYAYAAVCGVNIEDIP